MRNGRISGWLGGLLFLFLCFFGLPGQGWAGEFVADIYEEEGPEKGLTGRIFIKGSQVRLEISEGEEADKFVAILRLDEGVVWALDPEDKTYTAAPYGQGDEVLEVWSAELEKKARYLGREPVSGFPCKKYELVEAGERTFYWISDKSPWPLRIKDSESLMELRNISQKPLPDSLFEIPAGYKPAQEETEAGQARGPRK